MVVSLVPAGGVAGDQEVMDGFLTVLQLPHTKLQILDGC